MLAGDNVGKALVRSATAPHERTAVDPALFAVNRRSPPRLAGSRCADGRHGRLPRSRTVPALLRPAPSPASSSPRAARSGPGRCSLRPKAPFRHAGPVRALRRRLRRPRRGDRRGAARPSRPGRAARSACRCELVLVAGRPRRRRHRRRHVRLRADVERRRRVTDDVAIVGIGIHPFGRHDGRHRPGTWARIAVRAGAARRRASRGADIQFAFGGSNVSGNAGHARRATSASPASRSSTSATAAPPAASRSLTAASALRAGEADARLVVGFDKHPRGAFDRRPGRLRARATGTARPA